MKRYKIIVRDHTAQLGDAREPSVKLMELEVEIAPSNIIPKLSLMASLRNMYPSEHVEITYQEIVSNEELKYALNLAVAELEGFNNTYKIERINNLIENIKKNTESKSVP